MGYDNIKVLIIDDEEDLAELCAESFESEGLENVSFVVSPTEALKIIEDQSVDVILSDATMPEMDGYELYKRVKEIYKDRKYLFYFITGSVSIGQKEVEELGATGLISKPFDLDELVERVKVDIDKYLIK
ncbi:MAG: response regulator [Bacteriovoracaceae bacterium]|nr:response regulator [Bacteriovoracaceae bacterium]